MYSYRRNHPRGWSQRRTQDCKPAFLFSAPFLYGQLCAKQLSNIVLNGQILMGKKKKLVFTSVKCSLVLAVHVAGFHLNARQCPLVKVSFSAPRKTIADYG